MGALIAQSGMISHAAAGYDPDAQAIFDMLTTPLSSVQMSAISDRFKILKGENIGGCNPLGIDVYSKLRFFYAPLGISTEEMRRYCWKRKAQIAMTGVTTSKALGFTGGVGGSYSFDTGFTPSAEASYSAGSATMGCFITALGSPDKQQSIIGQGTSGAGIFHRISTQDGSGTTAKIAPRLGWGTSSVTATAVAIEGKHISVRHFVASSGNNAFVEVDGLNVWGARETGASAGTNSIRLFNGVTSVALDSASSATDFHLGDYMDDAAVAVIRASRVYFLTQVS